MPTDKQYPIKPKLAIGPVGINRIKLLVDGLTARRVTHGREMGVKAAHVYHYTDEAAEHAISSYFHKSYKLRQAARSHEEAGGDCYLVQVHYGNHPGDHWQASYATQYSYLLLAKRPDTGFLSVLAESNAESLRRGVQHPGIIKKAKSMRKKVRESLRTYGPIELVHKPKVRESWLPFPEEIVGLVPGASEIAKSTPEGRQNVDILLSTPTMYDTDNVPIKVAAATVVSWDTDTMKYVAHHTLLTSLEYETILDKIRELSNPQPDLPQAGRPAIQIEVTLAFPCEPTANQVRDALHDIADKSRDCLYDQSGTFQPCESLVVPMLPGSLGAACIAVTRPEGQEAPEAKRT
ncbi:hypothetical protein JT27_18600 [Alcaligenes faecalis]|uniref:hypothetical protein n=1 Tax=Alcaligenes faecalis TaxID=511 RepID=UPI00052D121F|nr:hypothetical protein [Alcaligenes faecalis]KGP00336.1 hypothetical protein JT27_18600 [Alcaligenes faecalis]